MKPYWKVKKKQVGLVHVAKADLIARGVLDEEGYRDLLRQFLKADGKPVESSKDLTNEQLDELMAHFQKCGFVYRPRVKQAPAQDKKARNKKIYLEAIQTALGALGKDWAYAEGIAAQMGFPRKLEWCKPEQLHQVQIALIYQERRLAGDPPQPRPETLAKRRMRTQRRKDAKAQEMGEVPF